MSWEYQKKAILIDHNGTSQASRTGVCLRRDDDNAVLHVGVGDVNPGIILTLDRDEISDLRGKLLEYFLRGRLGVCDVSISWGEEKSIPVSIDVCARHAVDEDRTRPCAGHVEFKGVFDAGAIESCVVITLDRVMANHLYGRTDGWDLARRESVMGEESYHEETILLDDYDTSAASNSGICLRQIDGDYCVFLGVGQVEHDSAFGVSYVDPEIILTLDQDEAQELHSKLEHFLYARCERCDVPIEGTVGVTDKTLLCDECSNGGDS